jgi:hypothetical protein
LESIGSREDNNRVQRSSDFGETGQTLLTLDNVGRLSVPQLCLSGDCRDSWPNVAAGSWVREAAYGQLELPPIRIKWAAAPMTRKRS